MESLHSNRMTDEEKEEAEQIGVVWDSDPQAEADDSSFDTWLKERETVEYWLRRMDEIMPETE